MFPFAFPFPLHLRVFLSLVFRLWVNKTDKSNYTVLSQIYISSILLYLAPWNVPESWSCPDQTWVFSFNSFSPSSLTSHHQVRLILLATSQIHSFFSIPSPNIIVKGKTEETGFRNEWKPRASELEWVAQRIRRLLRIHSSTDGG